MNTELTYQQLLHVVEYNPSSGLFTWHPLMPDIGGSEADELLKTSGYFYVKVGKKRYYSHRLAWFYTHGRWPLLQIDHIDRNRTNNRLSNLREASHTENAWNRRTRVSKSGFRGVVQISTHRWAAKAYLNNRLTTLGHFDSPQEASACYENKIKEVRGRFYLPPPDLLALAAG